MDMQNVSSLQIPEGIVRTIHDKDNRLLWGRVAYNTKYDGNTVQNGTPTPDTPVPVQTVTGEQTVTVSGKNLFQTIGRTSYGITGELMPNGLFRISGTATGTYSNITEVVQTDIPAGTYTFSLTHPSSLRFILRQGNTNISVIEPGNVSNTFTATSTISNLKVWIQSLTVGQTVDEAVGFQVEAGSTATAYEPYQSQSYTISLGSIELCKIGDYQDYIYKSGDDWYVHKDIGYMSINVSNLSSFNSHSGSHVTVNYNSSMLKRLSSATEVSVKSANYIGANNQQTWGGSVLNSVSQGHNGNYLQFALPNSAGTSYAEVYSYFENHPTSVYYALATPTETQITDAGLIAQLDAVHQWLARYGYNSTVTGNLPLIIYKTNL